MWLSWSPTALHSHCNALHSIHMYGARSINSQLKLSKCCPTYKSIDGLQKATTESFHCVTYPSTTSRALIDQSGTSRWKQWPLRWWHLLSQQTTLEKPSRETEKHIILGAYWCAADNKARGGYHTIYWSVFYVLLVIKCEYPLMTAGITCILVGIKFSKSWCVAAQDNGVELTKLEK